MSKKIFFFWIIFFGILMSVGSVSAAIDPVADVQAAYLFDTSADDSTAHVLDGSVTGATLTVGNGGYIDEAYEYDGSGDYIDLPTNISLGSWSIAGWVFVDDYSTRRNIFAVDQTGTNNYMNLNVLSGGDIRVEIRADTSNNFNQLASTKATIGVWEYYTVTYDSGSGAVKIYINGTDVTGSTAGSPTSGSFAWSDYAMWGNSGGSSNDFDGKIDEGTIFDRVLTSGEVSTLYDYYAVSSLQYPWASSSTANLSITITDDWDASAVNNVSATLLGETFSNATGNIIYTNVTQNESIVTQINITGENYFNYSADFNLSTNVAQTLFQTETAFVASEILTNNSISGVTFTIDANTDNPKYLKAGTYNVTASKSGYYDRVFEFSVAALSNSTINVTDMSGTIINLTAEEAVNGGSINDFNGWLYHYGTGTNITFSTTNGYYQISSAQNEDFLLHVESDNYTTTEINITPDATLYNYTVEMYQFNSVFITFKDYITKNTISGETITLDLISTAYSNNYSTTNGTVYATILDPETYTARYSGENYTERFYLFTVNNDTAQNLTLYMIPNTDAENITITVYDQNPAVLPGAVVKAQRYDLSTNSFLTQEIATTDVSGSVIMSLTLNDEFYKFIVEYNDNVLVTTDQQYITSSPVIINVNTGVNAFTDYFNYLDISGAITFSEGGTELNATFTYNDASNIGSQFCLEFNKISGGSNTNIGNSCSTSSSGAITISTTIQNDTLFVANGYYDNELLSSDTKEYYSIPSWGLLGIVMIIFILIVFCVVIASADAALIPIVPGMVFAVTKVINMHDFGWGAVGTLLIVGIIITLLLKGGRS